MGSGCGIYSKSHKLNLSQALGFMPSVLQTELIGITIAAEHIANKNITGKNVHIYTNCRQAVLTLSRPRLTSELVQQCHRTLIETSSTNAVKFSWIKGHNHNKGNRAADSLAKKAARLQPSRPESFVFLTMTVAKNLIKERSRWNDTIGCNLSKALLSCPDKAAARRNLSITRKRLRLITGILTSHCKLNKHLFRMKLSNTPLCRACNQEDENMEQILCDCSTLHMVHT